MHKLLPAFPFSILTGSNPLIWSFSDFLSPAWREIVPFSKPSQIWASWYAASVFSSKTVIRNRRVRLFMTGIGTEFESGCNWYGWEKGYFIAGRTEKLRIPIINYSYESYMISHHQLVGKWVLNLRVVYEFVYDFSSPACWEMLGKQKS